MLHLEPVNHQASNGQASYALRGGAHTPSTTPASADTIAVRSKLEKLERGIHLTGSLSMIAMVPIMLYSMKTPMSNVHSAVASNMPKMQNLANANIPNMPNLPTNSDAPKDGPQRSVMV